MLFKSVCETNRKEVNEMANQLRRFFLVNIALVLALAGSVVLPAVQTQAAAVLPNMYVTLLSGGSTYTSTVYTGVELTFKANVKNVGNVPLDITATLTPPANWDVNEKYDNCGTLAAGGTCTLTWLFTPQAAGQVYLRVYVRGNYTDANGDPARITGSPAFFFNVLPTYTWQTVNNGSISTNTSTVPPAMLFPSMSVTLTGNDVATYSETVKTGKQFIFRAIVVNTSNVPLQVVASLAVPTGWGVTQNMFNSCPSTANLAHKQSCEISWYFNPLVTGQVYLRVYVKAFYLDVYGNTQRITQAPAFIVNVVP